MTRTVRPPGSIGYIVGLAGDRRNLLTARRSVIRLYQLQRGRLHPVSFGYQNCFASSTSRMKSCPELLPQAKKQPQPNRVCDWLGSFCFNVRVGARKLSVSRVLCFRWCERQPASHREKRQSSILTGHCCPVPATNPDASRAKTAIVHRCVPLRSCSRWGLPGKESPNSLVVSYTTVPPLPVRSKLEAPSAVHFCGTILQLALTGRYPAPCPMEPGLSSGKNSRDCLSNFRFSNVCRNLIIPLLRRGLKS